MSDLSYFRKPLIQNRKDMVVQKRNINIFQSASNSWPTLHDAIWIPWSEYRIDRHKNSFGCEAYSFERISETKPDYNVNIIVKILRRTNLTLRRTMSTRKTPWTSIINGRFNMEIPEISFKYNSLFIWKESITLTSFKINSSWVDSCPISWNIK